VQTMHIEENRTKHGFMNSLAMVIVIGMVLLSIGLGAYLAHSLGSELFIGVIAGLVIGLIVGFAIGFPWERWWGNRVMAKQIRPRLSSFLKTQKVSFKILVESLEKAGPEFKPLRRHLASGFYNDLRLDASFR